MAKQAKETELMAPNSPLALMLERLAPSLDPKKHLIDAIYILYQFDEDTRKNLADVAAKINTIADKTTGKDTAASEQQSKQSLLYYLLIVYVYHQNKNQQEQLQRDAELKQLREDIQKLAYHWESTLNLQYNDKTGLYEIGVTPPTFKDLYSWQNYLLDLAKRSFIAIVCFFKTLGTCSASWAKIATVLVTFGASQPLAVGIATGAALIMAISKFPVNNQNLNSFSIPELSVKNTLMLAFSAMSAFVLGIYAFNGIVSTGRYAIQLIPNTTITYAIDACLHTIAACGLVATLISSTTGFYRGFNGVLDAFNKFFNYCKELFTKNFNFDNYSDKGLIYKLMAYIKALTFPLALLLNFTIVAIASYAVFMSNYTELTRFIHETIFIAQNIAANLALAISAIYGTADLAFSVAFSLEFIEQLHRIFAIACTAFLVAMSQPITTITNIFTQIGAALQYIRNALYIAVMENQLLLVKAFSNIGALISIPINFLTAIIEAFIYNVDNLIPGVPANINRGIALSINTYVNSLDYVELNDKAVQKWNKNPIVTEASSDKSPSELTKQTNTFITHHKNLFWNKTKDKARDEQELQTLMTGLVPA